MPLLSLNLDPGLWNLSRDLLLDFLRCLLLEVLRDLRLDLFLRRFSGVRLRDRYLSPLLSLEELRDELLRRLDRFDLLPRYLSE